MNAAFLDVLHRIADRVPRRLEPESQNDVLRFLFGLCRSPGVTSGQSWSAEEVAAADCVKRCSKLVSSWSDDDDDDSSSLDHTSLGAKQTPSWDEQADATWKTGYSPIPVAVLVMSPIAEELAGSFGECFDAVISLPTLVPTQRLADEVRQTLQNLADTDTRPKLARHRSESETLKISKLLVIVSSPAMTDAGPRAALRCLMSEIIAIQNCCRPWLFTKGAASDSCPAQLSVAVVARHAVDATRIVDSVISPIRHHFRIRLFESSATTHAFAAFLYEALPLFPVLLSSASLLLLRQSWNARHALIDVLRNFHAIVTAHIARDPSSHLTVGDTPNIATRSRPAALVQECLDAAGAVPTYAGKAIAFVACYEQKIAALQSTKDSLPPEILDPPPDLNGDTVSLSWTPLIHFASAPVQLSMSDIVGRCSARKSGASSASDAARVLAVLTFGAGRGTGDVPTWMPFKELTAKTHLTEVRLARALFELRCRQLVIVNLLKRQARATSL